MTWDSVQQFIRIGMQMLAGGLVSKGYITEDIATQLVGGVISLAGVAWWLFWNKNRAE